MTGKVRVMSVRTWSMFPTVFLTQHLEKDITLELK